MVTMNIRPPQFVPESCLYLSCGNELNAPSKLICPQSSFPQNITLVENAVFYSSVSSYFYFSGTGLFSPYTALLILEQELLIFFLCNVFASLPVVFYLVDSPSFLSNLAHSVLHLWNAPLGACVAADSVLRVCSSGKSKLFWDAAWLKNALQLSGQNLAREQVTPLTGLCPGAGRGAQSWILRVICWRSGNSQV